MQQIGSDRKHEEVVARGTGPGGRSGVLGSEETFGSDDHVYSLGCGDGFMSVYIYL